MAGKSKFEQSSAIPDALRIQMTEMTEANWEEYLETLNQLAMGIWVKEDVVDRKTGVDTPRRVYQQKPDKDALQYLMNQVVGKAKESKNVEGKINLIIDE